MILNFIRLTRTIVEAGEMAPQLRALLLFGGPSSVPSSHVGWFTRTCNSSSKGPNPLLVSKGTYRHVPHKSLKIENTNCHRDR